MLPEKELKELRRRVHERSIHLATADHHVAESERCFAEAANDPEQAERLRLRGGKFLKIAASSYLDAGLGLQAEIAWMRAAKLYDETGQAESAAYCRRRASWIPLYVEEPHDHA